MHHSFYTLCPKHPECGCKDASKCSDVNPRLLLKQVGAVVAIVSLLNLVSLPALAGYNPPDRGGPSRSGGSGTR